MDIGGSQTSIQLSKEMIDHKVPRNGGGAVLEAAEREALLYLV